MSSRGAQLLVQPSLQLTDSFICERLSLGRIEAGGDQLLGGGQGDVDDGIAHLGDGLGFGLGDAVEGLLLAPCDGVLEVLLGVDLETRSFLTGLGDDLLGLGHRVALLLLIVGQEGLGIFTQLAGFFDLRADLGRTRIERDGHALGEGTEDQDRHQDEGEAYPECGIVQH